MIDTSLRCFRDHRAYDADNRALGDEFDISDSTAPLTISGSGVRVSGGPPNSPLESTSYLTASTKRLARFRSASVLRPCSRFNSPVLVAALCLKAGFSDAPVAARSLAPSPPRSRCCNGQRRLGSCGRLSSWRRARARPPAPDCAANAAAHKLNGVIAIDVSSPQSDVVSLSRVSHKNSTQLRAEVAPWLLFREGSKRPFMNSSPK